MVGKPSTHSRRSVLVAGICSITSLSGCSMLERESPMLDVVFFNNTDNRFVIKIYLFARGEDHSNSDGRTFSIIDIEPQEEFRRENIAESQQYLIEYDVDKIVEGDPLQTDHGHAHFYPTDGGENPCVAFDIVDSGVLNKRVS